MKFKNGMLIIDDKMPDLSTAEIIAESGITYHTCSSEVYQIEKSIINNRFLWMYCQFDNQNLYGETVLDTEEQVPFLNTRRKNHVELRKQLFVAYDTINGMLYISDYNKRSFVRDYFRYVLDTEHVGIKNIYSSLEDFENSIKVIKSVRFVRERDLIAQLEPDNIFSPQGTIFGLDVPDRYSLQLEYNTPIEHFKHAIRQLKARYEKGYFNSILLIGENDAGIEENFNFNTLIKNIDISVKKNEDERYDQDEVKRKLISLLEEEDV